MKKVLIFGGSGTLGSSFIKEYYNEYEFYNFSRNDSSQNELKKFFPKVKNIIGSILDKDAVNKAYSMVRPDIVVHAAAIKHVDIAENNPIECCKTNINGSINIVDASIYYKTKITIGISTDKACSPTNVYGMSKLLMEKIFYEANHEEIKFACCRFANIAFSNGSVIPFWLKLKKENKPLKLTDKNMNRLIISKSDSAKLVKKAIDLCEKGDGGFVLSKILKSVNMFDLAMNISKSIEMVGLRPGEKINESLISDSEIDNTFLIDDNYVLLRKEKNSNKNKLEKELSSLTAQKMNDNEIKNLLYES